MYPLKNFIIVNLDCAAIPEDRRLPILTKEIREWCEGSSFRVMEVLGVYKDVKEVSYIIQSEYLWWTRRFLEYADLLRCTFEQESVLVDIANQGFLVETDGVRHIGVLAEFNPEREKHDGYSVIDGRHFTYKGGTGSGLNYSTN